MANYTYKCFDCEQEKDVSHGIYEDVEITCEHCGKRMVKIFKRPLAFNNPPQMDLDDL